MKDNSYIGISKKFAITNQLRQEYFIQDLYIEILIAEAILKQKQQILKQKIDEAIDNNDKNLFNKLAEKLLVVETQLNA
ncbi:IDEAL domain-containing protein [Bacillus kwashiorkori]|uniref:IDEAL domain-containing protein n=1 Tax=Bacillus kwashiorkori TaxID=1522318 RepID=UPI00078514D2|nr:IDEAL domain-containing protein [Bacillus kwashiorkori]